MKKCKSCQSEIDDKAKKCPKCHTDQRNWFMRHKIFSGILILVIFGIIIGSNDEESKKSFEQEKQDALTGQSSEITQSEDLTPTIIPSKVTDKKENISPTPVSKSASTTTASGYQAIYDKYTARLKSECPSLSTTECAELSNEGVSEMAEYMYSAKGVEGQYETYSNWASKLMDVYMQEAR